MRQHESGIAACLLDQFSGFRHFVDLTSALFGNSLKPAGHEASIAISFVLNRRTYVVREVRQAESKLIKRASADVEGLLCDSANFR